MDTEKKLTGPIEPATVAAVSARNVSKKYGKGEASVSALRDVDLDFERSGFTAIMGPSGSGKSTLMHCLAGLDEVDSGSIEIGGTEITGLSDTKLTLLRRERIGFVFQAFNLVPTLTAEQNIKLPCDLAAGTLDDGWFNHVVELLGVESRLAHRPHELSGGQQQRVAIARALLSRPEVIFADEPTGNLDSKASSAVLGTLRRAVREMGQSVIMVTHDPLAASFADRVVLLSDGEVAGELFDPDPKKILSMFAELGD